MIVFQIHIFHTDLNEDRELEAMDCEIKELKTANLTEESQIIKLKAEIACMEVKVTKCFFGLSCGCID
jgi:hypothetical protein